MQKMTTDKITMQEVADALGLSRNTVSKALNDNPRIPKATRETIIRKATQMGYKHHALIEQPPVSTGGTIAFFTSQKSNREGLFFNSMPDKNHFGSRFLSGFTERMSVHGYTLTIYILRPEDIASCVAPANFELDKISGILCIELFDETYCNFIYTMQKPTLFSDSYVFSPDDPLKADIVMMENSKSTAAMVMHMMDKGKRTVGFIGDYHHCQSFFERWEGYNHALRRNSVELESRYCILESDDKSYGDSVWLLEKLRAMGELPDAFMCANDYIATSILEALKKMGKSIPEDILVAGFDDAAESAFLSPPLSTVHIPSYEMGIIAADTMLRRIQMPDLPFISSYIQTKLVLRESTG
jgi:LacI family transcriptional regulator